jgi:hypothetical protein
MLDEMDPPLLNSVRQDILIIIIIITVRSIIAFDNFPAITSIDHTIVGPSNS